MPENPKPTQINQPDQPEERIDQSDQSDQSTEKPGKPDKKHNHLARVTVVPVANPETAPHLLELAVALTDPDEGKIIALNIGLGDADKQAELEDQIKPIVDDFVARECNVELLTHISTGVARGILDVTREKRADLVILGLQQPRRGEVVIGQVAENVAETASCNVLIYRASSSLDFNRIVVPANGSKHARVACRVGYNIARQHKKALQILHIQDYGRPHWQGLARIEQSISGIIPPNFPIDREVVTAARLDSGILTRLEADDLVIIGSARGNPLEVWLYGELSTAVLNKAPGPVVLSWHHERVENGVSERMRRWLGWLNPVMTDAEREEIVWQAQDMATPSLDYFVLIIIAAIIASLGLLLNSPAVIIGAMLVAPLMQPLIGFAVGLTTGKAIMGFRALLTVLLGVVFALAISFLAGGIVPLEDPTAEMLARSSPSLLDAYVALAAGFIGAYATARKDIPSALAGVAIAAALMPPLCTAALGLELGDVRLGWGALLLFITNIVFISIAAAGVFIWLGMRPKINQLPRRAPYFGLVAATALVMVVVVGNLISFNKSREITRLDQSAVIRQSLVNAFAPAEVVTVDIVDAEDGQPLRVIATLRTADDIPPALIDVAEEDLEAGLERQVDLGVVTLHILRGAPIEAQAATPTISPETTVQPDATEAVVGS